MLARLCVRSFSTAAKKQVTVGSAIPAGTLFEGTPAGKVETADLFAKNKKVVVFGYVSFVLLLLPHNWIRVHHLTSDARLSTEK